MIEDQFGHIDYDESEEGRPVEFGRPAIRRWERRRDPNVRVPSLEIACLRRRRPATAK